MKSLGLHEAASFLRMHPEEVRRRARLGLLPGAKPGKRWVFLEQDLADYLRRLYARPRQALQVMLGKEVETCHFADAGRSGGSTCSLPVENEYAALLGLTAKP